MNRAGRTLTAGFLVLTGAGFLTLSGAGIAHAQPEASPAVCTKIDAALKSFTTNLKANEKKYATDHSAYVAAIDSDGNEFLKITAQGSPALQSAAKTYVTDFETGAADNNLNVAKLTADVNRVISLACLPSGAPQTGGGSSAGLQDPALFGAGGAAALAGLVVVGLAVRNRSRASADQG